MLKLVFNCWIETIDACHECAVRSAHSVLNLQEDIVGSNLATSLWRTALVVDDNAWKAIYGVLKVKPDTDTDP